MERGQLVALTKPGADNGTQNGKTTGEAARPALTVLPGSAGEHILQEKYGTTERARRFYDQQVLHHLNHRMREFLVRQEMMFVATSDSRGECDCTFRAGPPGFVRVLDAHRLAWPEYRGNGVMASLGNLTENGHVGLLFVDFFRDVIGLHVNGYAKIVSDPAMRMAYPSLPTDPIPGRRPERWVSVHVEEAYIHCAKHIPRLLKLPRDRAWGSDDTRRKGGDFFAAKGVGRPWVGEEPPVPEPPSPIEADGCCALPQQ
jgi:predicted pyridoxine 5'-phosphate oxidase superfamily flavin-nucleotide-binding protein